MDFDWVTYAVNDNLPADPPNATDFDPDADGDGDVDGQDGLIVQRTNPSMMPAWGAVYGNVGLVGGQVSVPEPATLSLLLFGCLAIFPRRACRR